ncbi:MAG TPA: PadR family transcriptional regulator [Nitrososphaeraceae archaeon]|jgi:DNA-binding PadR family transcriptional regulator|nr:PadR family transcriptional regulator [Nitrososphaeraceae archaeon]
MIEGIPKDKPSTKQNIWKLLALNYDYVEGAQISNSFLCLLALDSLKKPMSTTEISQVISEKSEGRIFKISATLKDSLEYRLRKAGYVVGEDIPISKGDSSRKPVKMTLYTITPKGRKLLKGWLGFLFALS